MEVDTLAPQVSEEEAAAAAAFDADIDGPGEPVSEQATEPTSDPAPASEPSQERDYEAEAREMGWKPLEEFKGDPEKHRDPQTYVELASNDLNLLRDLVHSERKEKKALKSQQEETVKKIAQATKATIERFKEESRAKHKAEIAQLTDQRDRLFEENAGNPKAIQQITNEYEQAKENIAPPMQDEMAEWRASHPEFGEDPIFTAAVQAVPVPPNSSLADQIKLVDKAMSELFPKYYNTSTVIPEPAPSNGAPPANARSIEGVRVSPQKTAQNWSSLPPEAKDMYEAVKHDVPDLKKEDWAKEFHNERD